MSLTTKEILIKARTLIDSPEKWIQGHLCNTEETCFCLVGALNYAFPGSLISEARMLIKDAAGLEIGGSIPDWNDAPGRTHAEIMEVLDKAIAACPELKFQRKVQALRGRFARFEEYIMNSFEQVWAATGYSYGEDALENVKLGWHLAMGEVAIDAVKNDKQFEYFKVQKAAFEMILSGGSFLQTIGKAFTRADETNARKLYKAYKADFEEFYEHAIAREILR